jgi:hypothetical protein
MSRTVDANVTRTISDVALAAKAMTVMREGHHGATRGCFRAITLVIGGFPCC